MGDLANKDKDEFSIVDGSDNSRTVIVNANGSINVVFANPIPPTATAVRFGGQTTVTKLGGTNSTGYTIPNGVTLNLVSFTFGGYFPSNVTLMAQNAKCELWYRPNGTGNVTGQVLVEVIYLCAESYRTITFGNGQEVYVGNGTRALDMVTTNWGKDDAEVFRQFRGFY